MPYRLIFQDYASLRLDKFISPRYNNADKYFELLIEPQIYEFRID